MFKIPTIMVSEPRVYDAIPIRIRKRKASGKLIKNDWRWNLTK